MMLKNWGSCPSIVTVVILASLVGAIAPGCTSLATSSVQQGKNTSTINLHSEEIQANTENSPAASDRFGLQEGMPYKKAREVLIQKGWQPHLQGDAPNLNDTSVRELFDLGYQEVKDCSGTGLGPCRFEFTNAAGELLVVSAITAGASNRERQVWRWFIEKRTDTQQSSSSPDATQKLPFVGIIFFNFLGGTGTGQSITIQADGTTIIKIHGTVSSSVQYRGKFSNRIRLENGFGLILNYDYDKIYSLSPNGQIAKGCKGEGTLCESNLYQPPIAEGLYIIGGTDQGLEVKGEQYRYYDEGGEKEWRRISELSYVSDGVVFDGNTYWCISPRTEAGVCSENGWTPVR
ncbi:hypothetical protein [Microseira wollei]|uniref:Lipoprotein n=1 Tax=Microseira wollei NIES-4236 TaxID=2530354 RepID=A0AAV3XMG6_9CYAN|nr:hypothetical protein [Microseira wollei]GET42240.1 hypothetical protein MiSe_70540 [Microseira wollei NIES-4236]